MDEIWKPSDCSKLKLKVKKRNVISGRQLKEGPLSSLSNILGGKLRKNVGTQKRKNPFLCNNRKAKYVKSDERSSEDKENELPNFNFSRDTMNFPLNYHPRTDEGMDFEGNDGQSKVPQNDNVSSHRKSSEGFPTDWSLKTKIKFKSDKPFSWCANVKSNISSRGTVNFVRCLDISHPEGKIDKDMKVKVNFRKNLSYWRHPNLPCIPNFPLSEDETISEKAFTNICKDVTIRDNIMATWIHSFQSVFTLTRCGFCPYFYMCCQKFSCLFIAAGVLSEEMVGIVTPTTKGLRGLLHKEGIEFEMPHLKKTDKNNPPADDTYTGVDPAVDDTDEEFLSSIGLSKKQFSSIEKQNFSSELSQLNFVDNRAQSTVLVKDSHVNALFNFFINSDVIVAQSGALQGVPSTLLAPVAFEEATLQTLQCTQGPVKVPFKGGMKQISCLEISGPILPTHFYNICQLVKEVNNSFEASIYTNTQSNAFNCKAGCEETILDDSKILQLGVNKRCLEYLQKTSLSGSEALAHLQFCNGSYQWKMHSL